jgi:hypothetical protein
MMMSGGAPPLPVKPPGPTEPTLPEGAGPPSPEERKEEKCRKTEIKRVYDKSGKYWVDVEQLKQGAFVGAQWAGPDQGNQGQETILNLSPSKLAGGECGDQIGVGMNPSNPIYGDPTGVGEGQGPLAKTDVPSRKASYLESRNNIRRKFATKKKPECCKDMKRRVQSNNISPKYLVDPQPTPEKKPGAGGGGQGEEGEHPPFQSPPPAEKPGAQSFLSSNGGIARSLSSAANGGGGGGGGSGNGSSGGSGGKVPPPKPNDYKKAVRKSKDGSTLYLDVCIPKDFKTQRGGAQQGIKTKKVWQKGKVDLPPNKAKEDKGGTSTSDGGGGGSGTEPEPAADVLSPNPKGPFIKLDPYQVPVNFGPDSLAVEFFDGAGPGIEESQKKPPAPQ